MLSFNLLALAAAAVLPFVSAAPVDAAAAVAAKVDVHARGANVHAVHVDAAAAAAAKAGLHTRSVTGVASILTELSVNLGETLCEFHHFTAKNATSANITPLLKTVVSTVNVAVVDLKGLKGKPTSVIYASVDGTATVTVAVIAQLLANILCSICVALKVVLSVIADVKVLLAIIVNVNLGVCLCGLISAVIALVDGLVLAIVPLVSSIADLLVSLGLTVVGTLLTIC